MYYLQYPVNSLENCILVHRILLSLLRFHYLSLKVIFRFKVFFCSETPFLNKYLAEEKNKEKIA